MHLSKISRCIGTIASAVLPKWTTKTKNEVSTHAWRMFFVNGEGVNHSAWHELDLRPVSTDPSIITFVCEIPKGTRSKMELRKDEPYNPIAQDVFSRRPGKPLRYFTYGDIPFNYGFAPQTWEDPSFLDADTKCRGDGDPIDVVQISKAPVMSGTIQAVRVLGVLGLIDGGETDWKIITEPDHQAEGMSYGSLANVPEELKTTIIQWFREYKTTDGGKLNDFVFNGEIRGSGEALRVVDECSRQYRSLIDGKVENPGYWLR